MQTESSRPLPSEQDELRRRREQEDLRIHFEHTFSTNLFSSSEIRRFVAGLGKRAALAQDDAEMLDIMNLYTDLQNRLTELAVHQERMEATQSEMLRKNAEYRDFYDSRTQVTRHPSSPLFRGDEEREDEEREVEEREAEDPNAEPGDRVKFHDMERDRVLYGEVKFASEDVYRILPDGRKREVVVSRPTILVEKVSPDEGKGERTEETKEEETGEEGD